MYLGLSQPRKDKIPGSCCKKCELTLRAIFSARVVVISLIKFTLWLDLNTFPTFNSHARCWNNIANVRTLMEVEI